MYTTKGKSKTIALEDAIGTTKHSHICMQFIKRNYKLFSILYICFQDITGTVFGPRV